MPTNPSEIDLSITELLDILRRQMNLSKPSAAIDTNLNWNIIPEDVFRSHILVHFHKKFTIRAKHIMRADSIRDQITDHDYHLGYIHHRFSIHTVMCWDIENCRWVVVYLGFRKDKTRLEFVFGIGTDNSRTIMRGHIPADLHMYMYLLLVKLLNHISEMEEFNDERYFDPIELAKIVRVVNKMDYQCGYPMEDALRNLFGESY